MSRGYRRIFASPENLPVLRLILRTTEYGSESYACW